MIPKILLSIPIYSSVRPRAYFHHAEFHGEVAVAAHVGTYRTRLHVVGPRVGIRTARNDAVLAALESDATHLMFLDDDIKPCRNLIGQLLAVDQPIVGSLCHSSDGIPVVFQGSMDTLETRWVDHPKSGTFECWAVGTGAMLIRTEVFSSLSAPWFFFERNARSMDVNFCRSAQAIGIPVWCSADASVIQLVNDKEP